MKRRKARYLATSLIAKQLWCHQQAKFRCFQDEQMLKEKVEEIKLCGKRRLVYGIENIAKVFKKADVLNLTFSQYLRSFKCSFISYDTFLKMKSTAYPGRIYNDKAVLFFSGSRKVVIVKNNVYHELSDKFNKWKQKVEKIDCAYLIIEPPFFCIFPWDYSVKEIILKEDKKAYSDGIYYESEIAEKYPRIERYFKWHGYFIVASPDGITEKFCYEFKTVRNKFAYIFAKPVAMAQATLYSYFFRKQYIRVQFYFKDTGEIKTIYRKTDKDFAISLLKTIDCLLTDKINPVPPKRFKCNACEFKRKCNIWKIDDRDGSRRNLKSVSVG